METRRRNHSAQVEHYTVLHTFCAPENTQTFHAGFEKK